MPARKDGNLTDRRSAPSDRSQPLRSGSAASTCSSVNTAISRRYTVTAMPNQIVVAGAVIAGSMVLVAQRVRPPELAGRWELPGGKVAAGETEPEALTRELAEELGVEVAVGPRLGGEIALSGA